MPRKGENGEERIRILEKAVANLGDAVKKQDFEMEDELRDLSRELKALKLFLSRNLPEFKRQFPEIQRKVR
ncbi:MAG: hypothetical protein M0042_12315 [Nitrospiraceae bacterium]|nr:hypothetical protein [Nitrospiraceae bacterium]